MIDQHISTDSSVAFAGTMEIPYRHMDSLNNILRKVGVEAVKAENARKQTVNFAVSSSLLSHPFTSDEIDSMGSKADRVSAR